MYTSKIKDIRFFHKNVSKLHLYNLDLKLSLSYPLDTKTSMNICNKINSILPCQLRRSFANIHNYFYSRLFSRSHSFCHDYDCRHYHDNDENNSNAPDYEMTPYGDIPVEFIIR